VNENVYKSKLYLSTSVFFGANIPLSFETKLSDNDSFLWKNKIRRKSII